MSREDGRQAEGEPQALRVRRGDEARGDDRPPKPCQLSSKEADSGSGKTRRGQQGRSVDTILFLFLHFSWHEA